MSLQSFLNKMAISIAIR